MAVFTLKKYEINHKPQTNPYAQTEGQQETKEQKDPSIHITATDSVSSILTKALYMVYHQDQDTIDEQDSPSVALQETTNVAITTEDINNNPQAALNLAKKAKNLAIVSEGFSTKQEEWFLTNLNNLDINVFYTMGKFLDAIGISRK